MSTTASSQQKGFTIVELLIVIVVIGILAAITIVAYNGIQQRARDSERSQELNTIQKALELYQADKGGYPLCGATSGPNLTPVLTSGTVSACLTDELVPAYISAVPSDPTNSGAFQYWYGSGYTKNSATTFVSSPIANNYILGARQEAGTGPNFTGGWGQNLNVLFGSSN